jgi:hypothetical protein
VVNDLQILAYDRSPNWRVAAGTCIVFTGA